jgi:hypothetical protein
MLCLAIRLFALKVCFGYHLKNRIKMPEISRFLGIIIYIYYNDHNPPHFHAHYGKNKAIFSIEDLSIIEGKLPTRVVSIILEWAFLHRNELKKDWELAKRKRPLNKIKPLV